ASLPVEAADRAWNQAEIRAGADCEAEPPARTESRTDFMSCDVHAGRQRIRRHQPDRFRLQDAHAVKLAAVEQHLAEAQKIRNRGDDASAAREERLRLADVAIRERGLGLRPRHGDETGKLVLRYREAAIDHVQRREEAALQKLIEGLSRHDFNDAAEHVVTDGIFPDFARLVQKRQGAEARDEVRDRLVAPERRPGAVQYVNRGILKSG